MKRRALTTAGVLGAVLVPLAWLSPPSHAAITCASNQWAAAYYGGSTLSGAPLAERCDAAIDFDFNAGSPAAGVPTDRFSARWTQTKVFTAGRYRFDATADDGVQIKVDGAMVLDGWKDQGPTDYTAQVDLTAGTHTVVVEYYEAFGDALVRASYVETAPAPTDPPTACNGYAVDFFKGSNLGGTPLLSRCDPAINFDWNAASPAAAVPNDRFSARWTRTVNLTAGAYKFDASADDGIRVMLDGVLIIDGWKDQGTTAYTATRNVLGGQHDITVEYYEAFGDAVARFSYAATTPVEPPPTTDPRATSGEWKINSLNMNVRAVHTTLLNNGKLLLIAGSGNNQTMFAAGTFKAELWDPTTNVFTSIPVPEDMFCAGHAILPDGKVMVAGGNKSYPTADHGFAGLASNYEFNPATNTFTKLASMKEGRWYPALTELGNGNIRVVGGLNQTGNSGNVSIEEFNPYTDTWRTDVKQRWAYWGMYAGLHLMDDGRLFYTGANTFGQAMPGSAIWDLNTDQVTNQALSQPDLRDQAGSVLLPPAQDQKFMVLGGGNSFSGQTATNTTMIHDPKANTHVAGPNLPTTKMYVNTVILPDRTVLETGGADVNNVNPKYETSIYSPKTNAFTSVPNTPIIDRMYHSSALLLPDGRVVVMGSNPNEGTFEMRISIYSPAYLFKGARPTITAPANVTYGQAVSLGISAPNGVRDVSLVKPMSVTHQMDTNARLVDVPLSGSTGTIPANRNLLPPGPYMIVVTDSKGIPSVAKWVTVS